MKKFIPRERQEKDNGKFVQTLEVTRGPRQIKEYCYASHSPDCVDSRIPFLLVP